tara:strand:- start:4320 stop:4442 length:123 start_codon:yes stop_codon:yes gene_type:complete
MLGDSMNIIIEAIFSMIVSFGAIGIFVWVAMAIEKWRETS